MVRPTLPILIDRSSLEQITSGRHNKPLNTFLTRANKAVRPVLGGQVTYTSAMLEAVDWSLFDFV